jgi:hypothetical protein
MDRISTLKWTLPISAIYYAVLGSILYIAKMSWCISYASTWFAVLGLIVPAIFIVAGIIIGDEHYDSFENICTITFIITLVLTLVLSIVMLTGSALFRADSYYNYANQRVKVVDIETADNIFPALIKDGDTSKVPLYSEEEAYKKSKAELAKQTSLESQIAVRSSFTTQDVNDKLVYLGETYPRSVFKRNAENQYYIVDRNNGNAEAYSAKEFKYMSGKYFSNNAIRFLRKNADGHVGGINLELDQNGKPYYVASILDRDFFCGYDVVEGVVVMDPTTGKMEEYDLDEVPDWVDRVYPEYLLLDYIKYYGKYSEGFFNAWFAQKNVIEPTTTETSIPYEIIYIDGEAYLWTGMTSANADSSSNSNGIMLASLKTGEITYYKAPGVSERHAMSVAEDFVQEKGYAAGYPIPLKVNDVPAMFMIMRGSGDNIMGYSLVSYADYTKVAYSENLNDLITKFLSIMGKNNEIEQVSDAELKTVKGVISNIASEVIDGRTVYYIQVEDQVYSANSLLNVNIVFAKVGDEVEISFVPSKSQVIPLNKIKF